MDVLWVEGLSSCRGSLEGCREPGRMGHTPRKQDWHPLSLVSRPQNELDRGPKKILKSLTSSYAMHLAASIPVRSNFISLLRLPSLVSVHILSYVPFTVAGAT